MVTKALPPIKTDAALMALATDSAPTLAAKKEEIKTAEAQLDNAKLAYYPDFTVSGAYGYRENNPATGMARADLVSGMVGLSLALWAPVKQSRTVAEKAFALQATQQAHEDAINNVAATIAQLTATYRQAKAQANLYTTGIIPQATQTVESMRIGYQVNKVDFLNLARAQVTKFNYELDYWRAVATANQTAAALVAIIGKENIYE
jgi:outer membrane protein TolC